MLRYFALAAICAGLGMSVGCTGGSNESSQKGGASKPGAPPSTGNMPMAPPLQPPK